MKVDLTKTVNSSIFYPKLKSVVDSSANPRSVFEISNFRIDGEKVLFSINMFVDKQKCKDLKLKKILALVLRKGSTTGFSRFDFNDALNSSIEFYKTFERNSFGYIFSNEIPYIESAVRESIITEYQYDGSSDETSDRRPDYENITRNYRNGILAVVRNPVDLKVTPIGEERILDYSTYCSNLIKNQLQDSLDVKYYYPFKSVNGSQTSPFLTRSSGFYGVYEIPEPTVVLPGAYFSRRLEKETYDIEIQISKNDFISRMGVDTTNTLRLIYLGDNKDFIGFDSFEFRPRDLFDFREILSLPEETQKFSKEILKENVLGSFRSTPYMKNTSGANPYNAITRKIKNKEDKSFLVSSIVKIDTATAGSSTANVQIEIEKTYSGDSEFLSFSFQNVRALEDSSKLGIRYRKIGDIEWKQILSTSNKNFSVRISNSQNNLNLESGKTYEFIPVCKLANGDTRVFGASVNQYTYVRNVNKNITLSISNELRELTKISFDVEVKEPNDQISFFENSIKKIPVVEIRRFNIRTGEIKIFPVAALSNNKISFSDESVEANAEYQYTARLGYKKDASAASLATSEIYGETLVTRQPGT